MKLETRGEKKIAGLAGVKAPAFCELSMCLAGKKGREKKKNRVFM